MRLRLRVRLKYLVYLFTLAFILLLFTIHSKSKEKDSMTGSAKIGRSINAETLETLRHGDLFRQQGAWDTTLLTASTSMKELNESVASNPFVLKSTACNDAASKCANIPYKNAEDGVVQSVDRASEIYSSLKDDVPGNDEVLDNVEEIDSDTFNVISPIKTSSLRKLGIDPEKEVSYLVVFQGEASSRESPKKSRTTIKRRGYASRVLIENDTALPEFWTPSPNLTQRHEQRRQHVREVCRKHGLSERSETNQPNAWEFFVNKQHGLVWCSVFKAASSTWLFNFNILAGYSEAFLINAKDTPIALARKKYPRPSVKELDEALNAPSRTVAFMIARHPLERLVSAYRDKLQSTNRYYRNMAKKIIASYPDLGPKKQIKVLSKKERTRGAKKHLVTYVAPSFEQFVQFVLDSSAKGLALNEHWVPMSAFCTPCVVGFDVYAKVETLHEDGNYIIYRSGIKGLIQPKRINRSKNAPTEAVVDGYLCNLSRVQMEALVRLYKLDLELFQYDYQKYLDCTANN